MTNKTDDRRQTTDDGRQTTDDRRRTTEITPHSAFRIPHSALRTPHSALPILFFLLWAILFTFPLVTRMGDAVVLARGGDAWLHLWDLWWVDKALIGLQQNPYHTTYLLYPTGLNLYYHSLNLLNSLLSIPLQRLFGLTAAYNLLMILNLTLDGLAAYWLCLDRTKSWGAALVGGALFAAAPLLGTSVDLGQLDEVTVWWIPLYIMALWRALDGGWRLTGSKSPTSNPQPLIPTLAAGLCLVGASLATWYFTAGLVVFTILFVPAYLISKRATWQEWGRVVLRLAVAFGVFIVVLSPLLYLMIRERLSGATYMLSTLVATLYNSADLVGLVLPPRAQTDVNAHGSVVALGYVALALALVGLALRWRKAWPIGLALLGLLIMALGPELQVNGHTTGVPLPYALLNNVPFIGASRQPLRFLATAGACLSLLAAYGVSGLMGYVNTRGEGRGVRGEGRWKWRRAIVPALLILIVLELSSVPRTLANTQIEPAYAFIKNSQAERAVLEVPTDEWSAPALLHQTWHERPIIGGYTSRHFPYPFGDGAPGITQLLHSDPDPLTAPDVLTPSVSDTALRSLDHYGVRYIVAHKPNLASGREARLEKVISALFTNKDIAYEDDDVIIYQVPPKPHTPNPQPPLVGLGSGWHKAEDHPLHRWTGNNGADGNAAVWIGIPPGAEGNYTLKMNVYAYKQPRTLSVVLDGKTLLTKQVGTAFEDMEVDLGNLPVGDYQLLLKVDESPESPEGDERKLSVGVTRLAVERDKQ